MQALPKHVPARIGKFWVGKFWVGKDRTSDLEAAPGRASGSVSIRLRRIVGEGEKRLAQPAMGRVVVIGGVPQH